jgi:hypothetical protein
MFLYFTEKTLSDSGIAVLEVFFLNREERAFFVKINL